MFNCPDSQDLGLEAAMI